VEQVNRAVNRNNGKQMSFKSAFAVNINRLKTPLHVAADKGQFDLMDILLKHGAKVNCTTDTLLLFI